MQRFLTFAVAIVLTLVSAALIAFSAWFWIAFIVFAALTAVGVYHLMQPNHSVLRNYPILGHMRCIFEGIRP